MLSFFLFSFGFLGTTHRLNFTSRWSPQVTIDLTWQVVGTPKSSSMVENWKEVHLHSSKLNSLPFDSILYLKTNSKSSDKLAFTQHFGRTTTFNSGNWIWTCKICAQNNNLQKDWYFFMKIAFDQCTMIKSS
jgi:hypothetical protein